MKLIIKKCNFENKTSPYYVSMTGSPIIFFEGDKKECDDYINSKNIAAESRNNYELSNVWAGYKIKFKEEKSPWDVIYRSERFIQCERRIGKSEYKYHTVLDLELGIRGGLKGSASVEEDMIDLIENGEAGFGRTTNLNIDSIKSPRGKWEKYSTVFNKDYDKVREEYHNAVTNL